SRLGQVRWPVRAAAAVRVRRPAQSRGLPHALLCERHFHALRGGPRGALVTVSPLSLPEARAAVHSSIRGCTVHAPRKSTSGAGGDDRDRIETERQNRPVLTPSKLGPHAPRISDPPRPPF